MDPVADALAELRRRLQDGAAGEIAIPRPHAAAIAGELARLLQSSNRLRRQNGKLRRRIERLKAGLPDEPAEPGDED